MPSASRTLPIAVALVALGGESLFAQVIPGGHPREAQRELVQRRIEYRGTVLNEASQLLERWREAWNREQSSRLAGMYTEDATLVPPRSRQPARGRQEIEGYFQRALNGAGEIRVSFSDFDVGGNLAFAMGSFDYTASRSSDLPVRVQGSFVMVFRQDGNTWRIRSHLFRTDG